MEMQVSDDYLEIKKKKKTTNEHQPSILPPNNLHFEWGNGLPLYCTTTLLLSKYFGDLHSVGKI